MPCVMEMDGGGVCCTLFCLWNKTFKQKKIVKYNKKLFFL